MSELNPKLFVANRRSNRIAHRVLSTYERRNPTMFELCHSAHETWTDAHAALVNARRVEVSKAEKALASAKRALQKAMTMKQKGGNT